jgi:diphthamide synthase (EF-2-diphthine--ammonia ligase)
VLRQDPAIEVAALLTTVNEDADRVAMHAVRSALLDAQARATRLPLWRVPIPHRCSNEIYERRMRDVLCRAAREGFTHVAFGDLFLEDVRRYREAKLAGSGLRPIFPLWGRPTAALAQEMLTGGLRARVTCIDPRVMDRSVAGREFSCALLAELPASIDPCGERGEFHTFAYAGPMFDAPIPLETGEVVERDGFVFADLLLAPPIPASYSQTSDPCP